MGEGSNLGRARVTDTGTHAEGWARSMTLLEHLEELRSRLIKAILAFAVGTAAAWIFYDPILRLLIAPLRNLPVATQILERGRLIVTAPQEAFIIRVKVSALAGGILALPFVLWQIWRFVTPGLYAKERRYSFAFVIGTTVLFSGGAVFAFAILPQALRILAGFGGREVVLLPRASDYLSFVMLLVVAFGATFALPMLLLALVLAGVVTSRTLRRGRRVAWVVILVVAAVLTPTPDPINQLIMTAPLVVLYEGTVLVARLLRR